MGPKPGVDAVEKENSFFYRESNPGRPSHSLSLYRLSSFLDSRIKPKLNSVA
jgi:hypothetical protein